MVNSASVCNLLNSLGSSIVICAVFGKFVPLQLSFKTSDFLHVDFVVFVLLVAHGKLLLQLFDTFAELLVLNLGICKFLRESLGIDVKGSSMGGDFSFGLFSYSLQLGLQRPYVFLLSTTDSLLFE